MLKFSANQIAKALRLSYEAVRKRLVDAPCTFQLIAGNQTRVYEVRDLPEDYRSELEKLRNRFGYRDIESLLKDGRPAEIKPEYSQLRESELNQAHRLRRAMQRPLELEGKASSFEVAEAGLEDYKREFDDPISERSWQRKFAEILKRDNGRREWTRLELYVSERALIGLGKYGAKREALAVQAECKVDAENLQAAYRAVGTASEPTSPERAVIWHCAFQEYEAGCSQGQTERQARAPILAIMVGHEIRLCATPEAYKKFWQRSYPRWIEGGRKSLALNDSRHENKGRSPIIVPTQEEVAKVKLLALKTDPNLSDRSVKSLPWRMYAESGECRPELAEVINAPRSSKHTLTPTLRRAGRITSEEKMMVRGPRTYKNSAYKQLRSNTFIDESGTERELLPGMLFESDDMHLNEPFYIPWENATDTLGRKASEFEKATKLWLDVRNGKIHPAQAGFLSFEEVKQNLRKAMSFMNRDCMEGQIKGAPDDLWAAHFFQSSRIGHAD